jgi:two-component system cell cycle sensor histidine kinase/response regulator CckA
VARRGYDALTGSMSNETSDRAEILRECGIVESGLDDSFDRIIRLAGGATNARTGVIAFEYESRLLVKGYCGPEPSSADDMLPPPALTEILLAERGPSAQWTNDVAGAVIRAAAGIKVGLICVRPLTGRRSRKDVIEALLDAAELVRTELTRRQARRPDQRTAKILEAMTDAWVFLDHDWRYIYVNEKAGEIFARNPRELVGKHIWTEFPEGIGHPFHRAYEQAAAEQVFKQIEDYYPPYDRWFENRIYPSPEGLAIFFQDVTERRRAEHERRRLASIIENTTDLVAISNAEGGLLFLNRAARTALGIAEDADLLELHIIRVHAMDSRELLCDALAKAVSTGCWSGEATLVHTSGAKVLASEVILWHPAQAPEHGYFSLVARDITEQKRAEWQRNKDEELRAQTERMAHLGYWTWDIASNQVTWSDELYRIFGLEPGSIEVSFDVYLERILLQDRAKVRETIQAALRDRTFCTFEDRIVRPDGELRYLHSWAKVALNDDGQPSQMFGMCMDCTDLLVATEDLQETEAWLGAALRNTHIAVWEWDLRTNELKFSDGAAGALGQEPLATTYEEYLQHVHLDDVEAVMQAFRGALDHGGDVDLEHRVRAADGSMRWLVVRCHPPPAGEGPLERLLGTVVDVTERHRAEQDHRTLLRQLKDAQKMEAIGRLAAGVAHDFNNHLTVIQSAAELLLSDGVLSPPFRQLAMDLEEAAENAARLTKQLLTVGRQQQHRLDIRPLDLNELIRSSCKLLRHLLTQSIELELELAPELQPVLTDREQLERVLLNLVVNARDAMPNGGRLTIATRAEQGQATLEVRDSGTGMTPEIKEHIFEPFFTTKDGSNGSGTGLGLATVYGIVTQSGGSIEVNSEPGTGTTFIIRLRIAG